jgi:hypothetical protein
MEQFGKPIVMPKVDKNASPAKQKEQREAIAALSAAQRGGQAGLQKYTNMLDKFSAKAARKWLNDNADQPELTPVLKQFLEIEVKQMEAEAEKEIAEGARRAYSVPRGMY